ncbi:MAG: hypothetical protein J2P14_05430 [Acidothermales bacterium]|nr:hypothetical protein [Acidothermales bacterium]
MTDDRPGDRVWEDLLILVVVGAAVVYGYHRFKPKLVGWLDTHGVHAGDLAHRAGALSLDTWVNVVAILVGIALLAALWRGWRKVRRRDGRKERGRKVW